MRPAADPDLIAQVADLAKRVERLEGSTGLLRFTTAGRPPAAALKYVLIANTTTGKVEWSDGTNWNALY